MTREITFRRLAAGHYRNDETGVEIIKVARQRLGRNGWRAAGWSVTAPSLGNRRLGRSEVGFDTTLAAAKEPATRIILATRRQIERCYADAAACIQDRSEQDGQLANRAYLHPAYAEARVHRSHEAAMLAGQRAVIADDHAAAIIEHRSRWGRLPATNDPATLAVRVDSIRRGYQHGRLALDTAIRDLRAETGVTLAGAAAILDTDPTVPINDLADRLAAAP